MQNVNNLADIISAYKQYLLDNCSKKQAKEVSNQLETAIFRYFVVGYGFTAPKTRKLAVEEKKAGELFVQKIGVQAILLG